MAQRWDWIARTADVRVGVTTSRRDLTTSTVVGCGRSALLVDPAWEPDELAWIAQSLAAAGLEVTAGFSTHAHHDHLLWHPGLGCPPRWASAGAATAAAARRPALITALGPDWPADLAGLVGRVTAVEAEKLPWPGTAIELITHDAHASGHTALWIPATRTLLAGDMLSDVELPLLEESGPVDYRRALVALKPFVDRALVVIPGHGHPAIGGAAAAARWRADRGYLDSLITGADPNDPRTALRGMSEAHRHNRSRTAG